MVTATSTRSREVLHTQNRSLSLGRVFRRRLVRGWLLALASARVNDFETEVHGVY